MNGTFGDDTFHATGSVALDERGNRIGTVSDVAFDTMGDPQWLFVKRGLFHRERVVPADGVYQSVDGEVVLPLDQAVVAHAPAAPRDHLISPQLAAELREHYELPH